MKRSVRRLYTIVFLLASAVILASQTAFRPRFVGPRFVAPRLHHSGSSRLPQRHHRFNASFIKFAEIDVNVVKSKQEIEQLLRGNFDSHARYRSFASWRRFITRDDEIRTTSSSMSGTGRLPVWLQSPKFHGNWLEFRRILRIWSRNKRFQPEIMSEMISLVKNPIELSRNKTMVLNKTRYSSCAVVGNSGILLKREDGELIDGHEFVIRLNNARVRSFERNVGSKTSVSFINSNILHLCSRRNTCFCNPYAVNVPTIMYICQPVHFLDYTLCNPWQKSPLLVTDPRLDILCTRIVKYYSVKRFVEEIKKPIEQWGLTHDSSMFHYSSGMQAVMLALGICDKVSLFGFGKSVDAKHHYHTNQKAELHLHDYEAEYAFYRDLVERPQEVPFILSNFKIPPVVIHN